MANSSKRFEFQLKTVFEIHHQQQPINTIVFTQDGQFLLAGGDDRTVRVWSLKTFECVQIIQNDDWGQITAMSFIHNGTKITLCVGTGRGNLSLIPWSSRSIQPLDSDSMSTFPIFHFNDPAEFLIYDTVNSRLAAASQSGQLVMFSVINVSLRRLWDGNLGRSAPGGICFWGEENQYILTFALHSGQMACRKASNGEVVSKKQHIGAIGSVTISGNGSKLLIYNLSSGNFEIYKVQDNTLLKTLPINAVRRYIMQGRFLEDTRYAVCGSDTNRMHVIDLSANEVVASLTTGNSDTDMTQAVAVTQHASPDVFLAGSSGSSIVVWEKTNVRQKHRFDSPVSERNPPNLPLKTQDLPLTNLEKALSIVLFLTFLSLYATWMPFISRGINYVLQQDAGLRSDLKAMMD